MTSQQFDSYSSNNASFWLGFGLGLLLILVLVLMLLALIG